MDHFITAGALFIPIVMLVVSDFINTRNIRKLNDRVTDLTANVKDLNSVCYYSKYNKHNHGCCGYTNKHSY